MAKQRIFDLPETKGSYQLKGKVTGVEKERFYTEKKTKTQKDMRIVNFGAEYENGSTLYINLMGIEQENVYFSKSVKKGEKPDVQKVPWANRFSYNREGYRLIGNNIGVKKKVDENGNLVNDKKVLTDFDSCKEIKDNLKDGVSVFIKGNLDYSSFTDDKGNKRTSIKLSPNQVSLCSEINFDDEKFVKQNNFRQIIIFMGINKEKDNDDKDTGRFVVSAKIVTYATIEDVEFIIEDAKLASMFKKNLKPYNAIQVSGDIVSSTQTEEVEDEDNWGESDKMDQVSAPVKREFIITGAKGSTIDREVYTEENVSDALSKIAKANKAVNDFGSDSNSEDDWGNTDSLDDAEDEEAW